MNSKKVHILIEQGLQQVGIFAYSDFTHEEVDLEINKQIYTYLEKIFNPQVYNPSRPANAYEFNQEVLDRTRGLHVLTNLSPSSTQNDKVLFTLPSDYFHYIRSASIVSPKDLVCSKLLCNEIELGKTYKVLSGSILYKGQQYDKNDTFIGEESDTSFSIIPSTETVNVAEVVTKKFRNRVVYSTSVYEMLQNSLTATKINSPVAEILGNTIIVHTNGFKVEQLETMYCRKPDEVSYEEGKDLLFPDDVCYEIIDLVISNLSIKSEQSQQKIVNQIETGNVQR